jgi:hypothetical protein
VCVSETTAAPPQPPQEDLDLHLLRGRRGHGGLVLRVRVLPTALLLVAIHLAITAARLLRSWWWQDDLNLLANAAHRPLTTGLVFSDYNGHLVPGSYVLAWVFDRIAPLDYWPAALVTFGMVAALDVTLLALLRRMFGTRPGILVPFAMYAGTTLMLTSTLWWAAAMQWLPAGLSLAVGLYFHVGYLRSRNRWEAAGAVASVLIGVLFFEKALTTPLVLALYTVLYAVPGPLWKRPFTALRRYWGYWLAHAAVVGGFLWLYLTRVTIDTGPSYSFGDVVETVRVFVLETFLPSLIGGPLNWFSTPKTTVNAWAHPSLALIVVAGVLTAAVVIGSLVFVRGAWRAWLLLVVFLAISIGVVVRARLGFVGPFVGRDHRYLTDAAVLAPICLALAFLPLRDEAVLTTREARDGRVERWRAAGRALRERRAGLLAGAGAVAVLVMTAGGIFSGETFMSTWTQNPSKAYVENLSQGLADRAKFAVPTYLFEDDVPPDLVMTPTFLADRRLGHITRPMTVRPVTGSVLPSFSVVDQHGRLHPGKILGSTATPAAPGSNCATDTRPATMVLPSTPGLGQWKMKLDYLANRQTSARVRVGSVYTPVQTRLERGLHSIYVSLPAGGSNTITLDGLDAAASVCIGGLLFGLPAAAS